MAKLQANPKDHTASRIGYFDAKDAPDRPFRISNPGWYIYLEHWVGKMLARISILAGPFNTMAEAQEDESAPAPQDLSEHPGA